MPNGSGARPSHPAELQDAFARIWQDHLRKLQPQAEDHHQPNATETPNEGAKPGKPTDSCLAAAPSSTVKPAKPPKTQTVATRLKLWSPEALAMRQALLNPRLESQEFDHVISFVDDEDLLGGRRLEAECRDRRRRRVLQNALRRTIARMHEMGELASPVSFPASLASPQASPSKN